MTLLAVRGLVKTYGGIHAVDGVSFDVNAGEAVAVIGPNGAGKTTCFNMLGGQIPPDSGQVLLDGRNVTANAPERLWRMGVGRTFQVAAVLGSMTVRENVQMALISAAGRQWLPHVRAARHEMASATAVLKRLELSQLADRACATLAYGDLKRLELAIAIATGPRLLLMDEPTAGMSRGERGQMMDEVSALVRDRGIGVLFTEHDMDVVFAHADRIIVLDHGRIIAEGSSESVRANEQVREVYLGTTFARSGDA